MGWIEDLFLAKRIAQYGTQPRPLTDDDRSEWINAADARERPSMPRTSAQVQRALQQTNPVRWRQVQGDIKWIKKHLKRMGLNPEDWRFYV